MEFAALTIWAVLLPMLTVRCDHMKTGMERWLPRISVIRTCAIWDAVEIQKAGLVLKSLLTALSVPLNVQDGLTGLTVKGSGLISEKAGWKNALLF